MWANLLDGIRYVRAERTIALLVLLAAIPALFILNYLVLMPVFARDILEIGAPGLGLLTASLGVGALTGALVVAVTRPARRQRAAGAGRSGLGVDRADRLRAVDVAAALVSPSPRSAAARSPTTRRRTR